MSGFVALILCQILAYPFITGTTGLVCYCDVCSPNNTCSTDGYCFTSVSLDSNKEKVYAYRCMDINVPAHNPFPCQDTPSLNEYAACCNNRDLCNNNRHFVQQLSVRLKQDENGGGNGRGKFGYGKWQIAAMICLPVGLVCCLFVLFYWLYTWKQCRIPFTFRKEKRVADPDKEPILGISSLRSMVDWTNSGSGSGLPLLVQRSIARQIQLIDIIGKGRFGEVWKGSWRGEFVAVKIFPAHEERSWFREAEIYQTVMLRHENILGFVAADYKDNGTFIQLWLVADYHPNGSLYDFLNSHTMGATDMIEMALSIATGLAHLHCEIVSTQGHWNTQIAEDKLEDRKRSKPAIAHRDLKSKNILIKSNGMCAIGDLGLAVRHDLLSDTVDIPMNNRVGTKRYMAPEVLDETIDMRNFDSFKRADVYSFGLVLWEIARRCHVAGMQDEYALPYHNMVCADPSVDDMKKVVCVDRQRPLIPEKWNAIPALRSLANVMKECWYQTADSRLSALRIKKSLAAVLAELDTNCSVQDV